MLKEIMPFSLVFFVQWRKNFMKSVKNEWKNANFQYFYFRDFRAFENIFGKASRSTESTETSRYFRYFRQFFFYRKSESTKVRKSESKTESPNTAYITNERMSLVLAKITNMFHRHGPRFLPRLGQ